MNTNILKGAIYCRVSTDDQESNGMSLPQQKDANLKFARDNNLHVPEEYIFMESYSGGFLDRPQLTRVFDLASKGLIDFVILTKRDRAARDQWVFQSIMKQLGDANVKVFYSEEKLTGDIAMDNFMGSTIVGFAAWEREQIKRRTNAGKRQHAKSGKWPFGQMPYGYMKNMKTKELEIHPGERDIIMRIISMYLEDDMTLGQIAKKLTEDSVPPPTMSEKESFPQLVNRKLRKNAVGFWSPMALSRILNKAPVYTGVYQAFSKIYKKTKKYSEFAGYNPKEDWVEIAIPRILSDKKASEILEKLAFNKQFTKRKENRTYLLQGKLKCDCAPEYFGCNGYFNNKKNLRNYRCSCANHSKFSEDRHCKNSISGMKIDTIVLDTLKELCTDPAIMGEYIAEQYGSSKKMERNRIGELEGEILKLTDKRKRGEELYIEGSISKVRFGDIKQELDEKKIILEKELHEEQEIIRKECLAEQVQQEWNGAMTDEFKEMIEFTFSEAPYEELKKIFVDTMVKQVILPTNKEDSVRIIMSFPCRIDTIARYLDETEDFITHTDEQDRTHVVGSLGSHNRWKKLNLDPTKKPLKTRTVEWEKENVIGGKNSGQNCTGDDIIETVYTRIKEFYSRNKYDQKNLKNI